MEILLTGTTTTNIDSKENQEAREHSSQIGLELCGISLAADCEEWLQQTMGIASGTKNRVMDQTRFAGVELGDMPGANLRLLRNKPVHLANTVAIYSVLPAHIIHN